MNYSTNFDTSFDGTEAYSPDSPTPPADSVVLVEPLADGVHLFVYRERDLFSWWIREGSNLHFEAIGQRTLTGTPAQAAIVGATWWIYWTNSCKYSLG